MKEVWAEGVLAVTGGGRGMPQIVAPSNPLHEVE